MDYGVFPVMTGSGYLKILQNPIPNTGFTTETLLMTATSYRFNVSLGEFTQSPNRVEPSFSVQDNLKIKNTLIGQPKSSGLCESVEVEINGHTWVGCGLNQSFLLQDGTEKPAHALRVGDVLQGVSPLRVTWFNTNTANLASRAKYTYEVTGIRYPHGRTSLYHLCTSVLDHFALQCGVFVRSAGPMIA